MFRSTPLALVSALLCSPALFAQSSGGHAAPAKEPVSRPGQASLPATPAGQKLKAWIENFNAGDRARITKFAQENFSAKTLQETPAERCGEMDTGMRAMFGELTVFAVENLSENAIKALLTNKGQTQWLEVSFKVAPGPPHLVEDLNIGPGQRPAMVQTAVPAAKLTASLRAELIETVADRLAEAYVDAGAGRTIGKLLNTRLKAGAYEGLENPAQFAEAVTRDLQATNGDLHLSLRYAPPSGSARGQAPYDPFANMKQRNFGLGRAEILDGNVGYLEITMFGGVEGYEEAVVDALRFLSRTEAMILDVRRNPGGSGEMSHFLFSHFLGAKPLPTIKVRSHGSPEPVVHYSLADVPGPRRPDVPLYVLTSQATGSAAEEFSFVMKNLQRATLVGTRTAGAGHMAAFMPAGHGFTLGVSITHVSNPKTGQEWEQAGVQPDIAVPAEGALAEAHAAALRRIIDTNPDPNRVQVLRRVLASVEARRQPLPLDLSRMSRFAGTYGGRVVAITDGRVSYVRNEGALSEELTYLGGDRFALGATQFQFEEREGEATLTVEQPDGTRVSFPRGEPGQAK